MVTPLQLTKWGPGVPCVSPCESRGSAYSWCYWKPGRWEYCSQEATRTTHDVECDGECKQWGSSYFWCSLKGGGWDYCSPKPVFGETVGGRIEVTRHGSRCEDKCSKKGERYFWCQIRFGSWPWDWDYCSQPNIWGKVY